jgi:uncharacterized protein (TIGR02246 family)
MSCFPLSQQSPVKTSQLLRLAAVAAVVAACAPQPAPTPPPPDENAIRTALTDALAKFEPAIAAKDTAALANIFTEDATWVLADANSFTGRASIAEGASKFFQSFESFVVDQLVIDKLVVVSDSQAVTFAHGNYTLTVKGKKPEKRLNPFADSWRKGPDGVWRVSYEINADGPAPAAAATKP